jgi:hypothetical protein
MQEKRLRKRQQRMHRSRRFGEARISEDFTKNSSTITVKARRKT